MNDSYSAWASFVLTPAQNRRSAVEVWTVETSRCLAACHRKVHPADDFLIRRNQASKVVAKEDLAAHSDFEVEMPAD